MPLTGLFAGLTLGLLSLDLVGLKVCRRFEARRVPRDSLASMSWLAFLSFSIRLVCVKRTSYRLPFTATSEAVLQILEQGGEPHERAYARKIMPGARSAPGQSVHRPFSHTRCHVSTGSTIRPFVLLLSNLAVLLLRA